MPRVTAGWKHITFISRTKGRIFESGNLLSYRKFSTSLHLFFSLSFLSMSLSQFPSLYRSLSLSLSLSHTLSLPLSLSPYISLSPSQSLSLTLSLSLFPSLSHSLFLSLSLSLSLSLRIPRMDEDRIASKYRVFITNWINMIVDSSTYPSW